jgi:thiol-disulfide isomerase/thioredoxin
VNAWLSSTPLSRPSSAYVTTALHLMSTAPDAINGLTFDVTSQAKNALVLPPTTQLQYSSAGVWATVEESTRDTDIDDTIHYEHRDLDFPRQSADGIYQISTPRQHRLLQLAFPDRILVLKIYAPWCRSCLAMAPKFLSIAHSPKYDGLPLIFAEFSASSRNIQSYLHNVLNVQVFPTIQFSIGDTVHESFACGPSKASLLRKKLASFINEHVSAKTRLIRKLPKSA